MFKRQSDGEFSGFATGEAAGNLAESRYRPPSSAKRLVDIAGALACMVLFSPFFLVVAIGVFLSSPGPIFYAQRRVGLFGKSISVWKFRSMCANADAVLADYLARDSNAKREWERSHKLKNDPRVTRFGRFIRKTSLDELPQFWNVLRGDMSLVGPRPVTLVEKERYGPYWPAYCSVRPGISGLWQVSGRSRLSYERRVQLDAHYVRNWGAWMDFMILVKTIRVVLVGDGSH